MASEPQWLKDARKNGLIKDQVGGLPKPRKYRNKPCVLDGETFHSKKEMKRWVELKMLEKAGVIENLRRQVRYELVVNNIPVSVYTADFVYDEKRFVGAFHVLETVIEDTKSEATAQDRSYGIRKRLMMALYGIRILET